MKLIIFFNLFMLIAIVAILPTACDREYEHEHPTADTYIRASDKLVIDMRGSNHE